MQFNAALTYNKKYILLIISKEKEKKTKKASLSVFYIGIFSIIARRKETDSFLEGRIQIWDVLTLYNTEHYEDRSTIIFPERPFQVRKECLHGLTLRYSVHLTDSGAIKNGAYAGASHTMSKS